MVDMFDDSIYRAACAAVMQSATIWQDKCDTATRVAAFKQRMAERGLSFPEPVVKSSGDPIRPTKVWDVT